MPGQQLRQEDVEVVPAIRRVARRASVNGQRQRLTTRTRTSTSTIAISTKDAKKLPAQVAKGIATMHPAKKTHASVCTILTTWSAVDGLILRRYTRRNAYMLATVIPST